MVTLERLRELMPTLSPQMSDEELGDLRDRLSGLATSWVHWYRAQCRKGEEKHAHRSQDETLPRM